MGAREHVYIFLLRADIYIALVQYSIKIKLLVQYSIKIKYEQVEDLLVARILLVLRFLTALAWHTSDGGTEELTLCKEMGARGCLCVAATCAGLAGWLASMLLVHYGGHNDDSIRCLLRRLRPKYPTSTRVVEPPLIPPHASPPLLSP